MIWTETLDGCSLTVIFRYPAFRALNYCELPGEQLLRRTSATPGKLLLPPKIYPLPFPDFHSTHWQ